MIEITLPEIGDGIESGDVLEVLVQEGDIIEPGQDILELETDKATTGIPSEHGGRVVQIHVKEGDTAQVGSVLITLEPVGSEAAQSITAADPDDSPATPADTPAPHSDPPPQAVTKPPTTPAADVKPKTTPAAAVQKNDSVGGGDLVAAGPAIRRFARELGIDLARVVGTGKNGRITREDVLGMVREASQARQAPATEQSERDEWGPIHRERLSRIRQTIAHKMKESWTTAPRVTNFDDADVTELEEFRQSSKADYSQQGIKLTSMPFVIKAVAMALKSNPSLNAAIDLQENEVVYKDYVNVGIAIDTERGLIVPSLRGADDLSVGEIARGLKDLVEQVTSGEFEMSDLRGSSFTISNLGAIGGTYSTPIINVPEVAILLLGRSRKMPVVVADQVQIRLMMPLSLSYDHRLVDGGAAARFLNDLIGYLEAPSRLLLAP